MGAIGWVILAAVVIVVIAAIAWAMMQRRRTTTLRDTFGSEYDRTMQRTGDRRAAESGRAAGDQERGAVDLHDVSPRAGSTSPDRVGFGLPRGR